jgi:alkanesulfonate monooxygenase SsuD/methylene tetrahydromethanopterin reductase-like flavin-dependent oxidoreductase (luciferase family)
MELGIYTFGDITPDPNTGRTISIRQRYAEILAAAKLADEAGLDVFGVGEHHRLDIPISSPAAIMAAIAGATKRIRLTSAVTILSTLDPVRVFQDFATVDLLSGGRAEVIAGRGAFIESFALFGDDIADYDALFAEKLDLLLKLNEGERVTWRGRFRAPLSNSEISPRPVGKLPIWLGVGGNPESALRAGDLGLPLILANITQPPANFAGQIAAYRQRHVERGHDASTLKIAIATHVHVAKDSQTAFKEFYPHYSAYFREHAPRADLRGEISRDVYEKRAGAAGPILVGSPQQIIDKLVYERELFAHDRFLGQVDIGGLPYAKVAKSIELLATQVLPAMRRLAPDGVGQGC